MSEPVSPTRLVDGVTVPSFLYGTAWKEDRTEALTRLALEEGFRGVDTANQRRHYVEADVGRALRSAVDAGIAAPGELFVQTKFTFIDGQDHRLPYDPAADVATQVHQSFRSSLEHLGLERIDSYVLHGPSRRFGLGEADWQAWRAMEELCQEGRARLLGVSNVSLEQLAALLEGARFPPRFVQNRCFAANGWDAEVRALCREAGAVYQGFSLLTANARALARPAMRELALCTGRTPAQLVFRFALEVGMIPLTGTSSTEHMREDRAVFDFALDDEARRVIEHIGR